MEKRRTLGVALALFAIMLSAICFAGCANNNLPSTIATFDENRVYTSGNIKYVVTKDEVDIVEIVGELGSEWTIPETVDSKSVTRLSFSYTNEDLRSVTIPKTVYSIRGEGLFANCTNLTTVTFASGCSITEIPTNAFYDANLSSITIPKTVKSIALAAFAENDDLRTVTFEDGSELKTIGPQAFEKCSSLQEIKIPSKVEKIAESAFAQCSNLVTADFSSADLLSTIDQYAFSECVKLNGFSSPTNLLIIDDHAFRGCVSLGQISLNSNLKEIGDLAFYDTLNETTGVGIEEIVLPDSLLRLGERAFANSGVKELTVTSLITNVSDSAFAGCAITDIKIYGLATLQSIFKNNTTTVKNSLLRAEISDGSLAITDGLFSGCANLISVVIPSSVTNIGANAFDGCASIQTINLPSSIRTIADNTFKDCVLLSDIQINGSTINRNSVITSIGNGAFANCDALTSIELPNALTTISNNLFDGCGELTQVTLGTNVNSIGAYAFNNCAKLAFANELSVAITSIGAYAFNNCISLGISENHAITQIGEYAFYSCDMTNNKLVLGTSINEIGNSAFADVRGIEELTILTRFSLASIFGSTKDTMVANLIKVTIDSDDANNGMIGANEFAGALKLEELVIGDMITSIGNNAFSGAIISTLTLPVTGEANSISIGDLAFSNCDNLTEITIPNTIASVGSNAFAECDKLATIVLSDTVRLGDAVFFNSNKVSNITTQGRYGLKTLFGDSRDIVAKEITSITILPNATNSSIIEADAYVGCVKLYTITVPNVVTSIGARAFKDCIRLRELNMIDGNLDEIGEGAFDGCSALDTIDLGDSLTSIGAYTFNQCLSLGSEIQLPDSLREIGAYAFNGCEAINITLPSELTSIGEGAFANCKRLNRIHSLPDGVDTISPSVFEGCLALNTFTIDASIVTSIGTKAFRYCGNLVLSFIESESGTSVLRTISDEAFNGCMLIGIDAIPNSVTTIGEGAFNSCSGIKNLTLPSQLTTIGDYAFFDCSQLVVEFDYLTSIRSIGESSFEGCLGITNVDFSGNEYIGLTLGDRAFADCENLKVIDLSKVGMIGENVFEMLKPNSYITLTTTVAHTCDSLFGTEGVAREYITTLVIVDAINLSKNTIDAGAFNGCINLTSITINSQIQQIGDGAFASCAISSITLPESLIRIGEGAFAACTNLSSIEINASTRYILASAFDGCTRLSTISFADGSQIEQIGDSAFACTSITNFVFPTTVSTVSSKLFAGCSKLETITLHDGITSFGTYAFNGCEKLEISKLPTNVNLTVIPDGLFAGCKSIGEFELNAGITSIGEDAFNGCVALTLLENELPANLTEIGKNAFKNCSSLVLSVLPSTTSYIGESAFNNCSLITINSPQNATFIGDYAFANCVAITRFDFTAIVINGETVQLGDNIFEGCSTITSLTVLGEFSLSKLFGETVEDIKETMTSITILDDSTSLAEGMFEGFIKLTNVDLSGTKITEINARAFMGCRSLTSIDIPDLVTTIGDSAFANSGLRRIEIPATVTTIGDGLFAGCTSLSEVEILNETVDGVAHGIERIGDNMFESTVISSITIPESVKTLGANAFKNCTALAICEIEGQIDDIYAGTFASTVLVEIVLPDTIKTIGDSAFEDCKALERIITEGETTNLQGLTNLTSIGSNAFKGCVKITRIVLPESVESIGSSAFEGCTTLNVFTISDNNLLPTIEEKTFYNSGITSINIPSTVGYIGSSAFENAILLTTVSFAGTPTIAEIKELGFAGCVNLSEITIPATTSLIGTGAFMNCKVLSSVEFATGNETEIINISTFEGCEALSTVTLPDTVYSIGAYAFKGCTGLQYMNSLVKTVVLPTELIELGEEAFLGCRRILDLVIPDGLKTIPARAFQDCERLATIDFASVSIIGSSSFKNAGLESATGSALVLSDTVTTIGDFAFSNAFAAGSSITIGTSATSANISILDSAFAESEGLSSVVIGSKVNLIGVSVFNECKNLSLLNMIGATEITILPEKILAGCGHEAQNDKDVTVITSVQLPATLEVIGVDAFSGCNMTSISLGGCPSLIKIEDGAFAGSALQTVSLPNTVEEVGANAFSGCNQLTSALWSSSTKRIESGTFAGCEELASFTVLGTVENILEGAFNLSTSSANLTITFEEATAGQFDGIIMTHPDFVLGETNKVNIVVPSSMLAAYQDHMLDYSISAV